MHISRWLVRCMGSVLLVSGIVWLNPLIAGPWDGNADPATCFQLCVELSYAQYDVCLLECHRGAWPPEMVPEDCRSICAPQRWEFMRGCARAVAEGGCSVF